MRRRIAQTAGRCEVSVTICGHDRETLRWALNLAIEIDQGKERVVMHETRGGWASRNYAWRDIHDPAKLATIIAALLASWPMFESWESAGFVFIGTKANSTGYHMPQARAFALRLLDVRDDEPCGECKTSPTDCKLMRASSVHRCCVKCSHVATAQDIERMIGEL
jgi:hypothetical protein